MALQAAGWEYTNSDAIWGADVRSRYGIYDDNGTYYATMGYEGDNTALIYSSTDMINWSLVHTFTDKLSNTSNKHFTKLGNDYYYLGGFVANDFTNSGQIYSTSNGDLTDWSIVAGPWNENRWGMAIATFDGAIYAIGGVAYVGGVFYNRDDVWKSTDGSNWTQISTGNGWSGRIDAHTYVYDNKIYLVGGYNYDVAGSTNNIDMWSSSDGITWTEVTSDAGINTGLINDFGFFEVGNEQLLVLSENGVENYLRIYSSTDGEDWDQIDTSNPSSNYFDGFGYYDSKLWLIRQNSQIWSNTISSAGKKAAVFDSFIFGK